MPAMRASDERRRYLIEHPVLLVIALCAAIGGLVYLVFPEPLAKSSLGMVLPGSIERLWALAYAAGGGLTVYGMAKMDARYEQLGLLELSACYATYGYVIFQNRGTAAGVVAASVFLGLSAGTLARWYLLRYEPEVTPWRRRRR